MAEHGVGQVCLKGHVISSNAGPDALQAKPFCSECGSKTITACTGCARPIEGRFIGAGVIGMGWEPPKFCPGCGAPYPWIAGS
jgi:hypothetical protein